MTGKHSGQTENHEVKRYDALAAAEHIPEMVERIVREFDPLRIILFGSHARGDATRWSDIDLLVVFDGPVDKRHKMIEVLRLFSNELVDVDVIVTWPEEIERRGKIRGDVLYPSLSEGIEVYERV